MELLKNQIYTVDVTDLNNLGYGIARIDGMVVFIPNAVDGDRAEVRIIKVTRTYCVGRVVKLLSPSPFRISSPCGISGQCGGCMYMAVDYAHELDLKQRRVRAAFAKAGLPDAQIEPVIAASDHAFYRNKIQIPVSDGKMGYYAAHSHRIVEMSGCQLHLPCFDGPLDTIRAFLARYPGDAKHIRHVYLRAGEGNPDCPVMVCLVTDRPLRQKDALIQALTAAHPAVKSIQLNYNLSDGNVILGDRYELLWGDETIEDRLGGLRFCISPASFYQVNRRGAETAYRKLLELAGDLQGETLLDLYCGIGTIGLFLKRNSKCEKLIGVEVIPRAVEDARRNAALNQIENAEFFCGDAFYDNGALLRTADTVVVDPPRKGCSSALISKLCEVKPHKILYMSCEAETLARDAALLCAAGYRMSPVTPVDLFPRTGHVETVVLMSREDE